MPQFIGDRLLLTAPETPQITHGVLIVVLLGLRYALRRGVGPSLISVIALLVLVASIASSGEALILSPIVQGGGHFEDQLWGQVDRVDGSEVRLLFEDGSRKTAHRDKNDHQSLTQGSCLTVDFYKGRFGVSWIVFSPHLNPDGSVIVGHCFQTPVLENAVYR